jgi:protein-S-isoprenylcysteine O-methyltransferase Ste14
MVTGWLLTWLWALYWLAWGVFALINGEKNKRIANSLAYIGMFILVFAIASVEWWVKTQLPLNILPSYLTLTTIGYIFITAGFAFTLWARIIIGRNWSGDVELVQEHKLVITGPYKLARHPIYAGIFLAFLGTVLILVDVTGIVLLLLSIYFFTKKSIKEEKLLIEAYGNTYKEYKKHVKMFLPYIF